MKKTALFLSAAMLLTLLVAPASAASFVSSVEQKEAPTVATVVDSQGNEAAAVITDDQGNELGSVSFEEIIVVPVSQTTQAAPGEEVAPEVKQIQENLTKAYEQVKTPEFMEEMAPAVEEVLQEIAPEVKAEDLVVSDVFDVSLTGAAAEILSQPGASVTINFSVNVAPSTALVVMHNYADDLWEAIPNDRVSRNADGTVGITFTSLSPIVFLVDSASVEVDPDGPQSPQTGDNTGVVVAMTVVLMGCVLMGGAVLARKKFEA